MPMLRIWVLCVLLAVAATARAAVPEIPRFRVLGPADGLPATTDASSGDAPASCPSRAGDVRGSAASMRSCESAAVMQAADAITACHSGVPLAATIHRSARARSTARNDDHHDRS